MLTPKQSFQHTLQEISVNRESPCELVRELVSNSYDADAKNILVFPLLEKKGLIFFDDGIGLSMAGNTETEASPYVAFFSIGFGTKTRGEQIGYKCQGSKLCFASSRFALITRCAKESSWRYLTIENPKSVLNSEYDLTPKTSISPEKILQKFLFNPDKRTKSVLNHLNNDFFKSSFKKGTMIVIEGFEATEYEKYFSVESLPVNSYLYNYIRFYTAHGDTRLIKTQQGFSPREVNSVLSNFKQPNCTLKVWMWMTSKENSLWRLADVFRGWPYLDVINADKQLASPNQVNQLRSASFYSRHATTFKFDGQVYTLIFAIDGKRRALDGYPQLGRQGGSRSGITLSSQQGVCLSSYGVKICSYNKLFDNQILSDFSILKNGTDHFTFVIDGDFELITSRNQLAEKSKYLLSNTNFLTYIRDFLQDVLQKKNHILKELLQRLNRETTDHDENTAIKNLDRKKDGIIDTEERKRFHINRVNSLKGRWFVTPIPGEEHFVGALYTLFSHIILPTHKLSYLWKRPLTFSGVGIDAIAVDDEDKEFERDNLIPLEYKYWFSLEDEFNHPLSIVNRIVCWDFSEEIQLESHIKASHDYVAKVTRFVEVKGVKIGLEIGDIRKKSSHSFIGNTVIVLSLERLLGVSFDIQWLD
ncbi:MAG: hypothetical protein DRR19_17375 [Candidatus Parabeggiatoa sp. nov. 1]|nr:MAG: hypothetical protein DRR19_17375 [Gammaproteobacteria bacterium]